MISWVSQSRVCFRFVRPLHNDNEDDVMAMIIIIKTIMSDDDTENNLSLVTFGVNDCVNYITAIGLRRNSLARVSGTVKSGHSNKCDNGRTKCKEWERGHAFSS